MRVLAYWANCLGMIHRHSDVGMGFVNSTSVVGRRINLFWPNCFRPARLTCFGQCRFKPIPVQANTALGQRVGGGWAPNCEASNVGARRVGTPTQKKGGGPKGRGPKFHAFFQSPAPFSFFFSLSLRVFSWNFGGV